MALEDLTGPDKFIDALVNTNPPPADPLDEGNFHLSGIKNVLGNSFPAITGAVTATQAQINSAVQPGSSPAFARVTATVTRATPDYTLANFEANTAGNSASKFASIALHVGGLAVNQVGLDQPNGLLGFFDGTGIFLAGYSIATTRMRGGAGGFEVIANGQGYVLSQGTRHYDANATASVLNLGPTITTWQIYFDGGVAFFDLNKSTLTGSLPIVAADANGLTRTNTGFRTLPNKGAQLCDAGMAPAIQRGGGFTDGSGFLDIAFAFSYPTAPRVFAMVRDGAAVAVTQTANATVSGFRVAVNFWNGSTFVPAAVQAVDWVAIPNEITAF